jgi:type IX secretion system PorP/SprF family membrane protein
MLSKQKTTLLIFQLCIGIYSASAQDLSFAQLFSNKLHLNPAYAGNPNFQRANLVYRNQWLTPQSPYVTYGVSADRFFEKQNSGIGICLINDSQGQGAITSTTIDVQYSYNIKVSNEIEFRGGIQAGGLIKSQNTSKIIYPDMIDNTGEIIGNPNFSGKTSTLPDFAAGIVGEYKRYYGGFAIHHLVEPSEKTKAEQNIVLNRKFTLFMGTEFNLYKNQLKKYLWFSPNIIYTKQADFQQLNLGMYLTHENLVTGFWLKQNIGSMGNTIAIIAGYTSESYSFAYSYDFGFMEGGFDGIKTSSHEVTFGMNFKYKNMSQKKLNTIKCPKF